jgi:tRNA/rRNA methyltransferase
MLENCRVVLVRPRIAANVGATARIMRNMGPRDLVLVDPQVDPLDAEARKLSTHGEEILHQTRSVPELTEAVADCVLVAATSARTGGLFRRQSVGPPEEIIPHLVDEMARSRVAIVFGPETTGLTNAEVACCHYQIHIPADPSYPTLNLAQAVTICLYELRRAWLKRCHSNFSGSDTLVCGNAPLPAPYEMQERMFADLRSALEEVHFLYGPKADSLMHALRHLIGRAKPTEMEVDLLLGLARQLRWYVDHHREA